MAGEIQLNSTTMATESSGAITLSNVNSATNRTNLGLGSIATQASNSIDIDGGAIDGTTIGGSTAAAGSFTDLQFNSGFGSVATAYGCRAWVNFNGTGTPAIRDSGNVSSITDLGTGNYTVNLTNAMPDTNYAVAGLMQPTVTNNGSDSFANATYNSTSSVTLFHYEDGTIRDSNWVSVVIFR